MWSRLEHGQCQGGTAKRQPAVGWRPPSSRISNRSRGNRTVAASATGPGVISGGLTCGADTDVGCAGDFPQGKYALQRGLF